jgi:hypothetical protein
MIGKTSIVENVRFQREASHMATVLDWIKQRVRSELLDQAINQMTPGNRPHKHVPGLYDAIHRLREANKEFERVPPDKSIWDPSESRRNPPLTAEQAVDKILDNIGPVNPNEPF